MFCVRLTVQLSCNTGLHSVIFCIKGTLLWINLGPTWTVRYISTSNINTVISGRIQNSQENNRWRRKGASQRVGNYLTRQSVSRESWKQYIGTDAKGQTGDFMFLNLVRHLIMFTQVYLYNNVNLPLWNSLWNK